MSKLRTLFSRFFTTQQPSLASHRASKQMEFPTKLLGRHDVFQYLNFNIPDLQPIKLSLDFDKKDKAFEQFFRYLKMRNFPATICNWWKRQSIIDALNTHYASEASKILDAANAIMTHQLLLFSSQTIQTDTPILWNRDYEAGTRFEPERWKPDKQYARSQLLDHTQSDIYFVWELNRHRHFLDLGKAYWYSDDERFAEEFVQEVESWIEQNPYPNGINWVDPYEIAIRGLFWLFSYNFFLRSDWFDEDFFCQFYKILLYHGHVTYNALQKASRFSSLSGGSLVAQAAFLYLLGTLFPEYLHSKQWSVFGWEVLQGKSPLLSFDDLTQQEIAPLVNSIELYCVVLLMRQHNRYHTSHAVSECLTTMLEQLLPFLKPGGRLCRVGEEYPQQFLTGMYGAKRGDVRYVFSMAALVLKNPMLAAVGRPFDPMLLWFFGHEGREDFANLPRVEPEQKSYLLPDSSYAVMRNGWDENSSHCLVTASRKQKLLRHSDLLSVELTVHGQEFLIDSGPYSFHQQDKWNQYFGSIQAHNSIAVDRGSHIAFEAHDVECHFDRWVSTESFDYLSGYHTGFEDLDQPIRHRRTIFYYKPDYWIVCDLLTGEGQHFFDQYFHFPPFRLQIDFTNKRVNVQVGTQRHFTLMPFTPREMDVSIFTGGETPDSGWIADGYKTCVEAPLIQYGKQAMAPTTFHTLLCAYPGETPLNFSGRQLQALVHDTPLLAHEVSALEVSCEEETHYFIALHETKTENIRVEEFTFNGMLCFLRYKGKTLREIIVCNATLLMMEEQTLFRSKTPIDHMTLVFDAHTLRVKCLGNYTFEMDFPDITEVVVNERKAFVQNEGDRIVVSTSRV